MEKIKDDYPALQENNRDKKGRFISGSSGNPKGRPEKTSYISLIEDTLVEVKNTKNISILENLIRKAFINDRVLIAVIKKLIPDAKIVELENESEDPIIRFEDNKDEEEALEKWNKSQCKRCKNYNQYGESWKQKWKTEPRGFTCKIYPSAIPDEFILEKRECKNFENL